MARTDFTNQLQALGISAQLLDVSGRTFVVFDYTIPVGRFYGKNVRLALEVRDSFPMDPPPGPHFNAQLMTVGIGGGHPYGGIHASPLGADWQYWSRPFSEWATTDKSARTYLAHLKNLLATV